MMIQYQNDHYYSNIPTNFFILTVDPRMNVPQFPGNRKKFD